MNPTKVRKTVISLYISTNSSISCHGTVHCHTVTVTVSCCTGNNVTIPLLVGSTKWIVSISKMEVNHDGESIVGSVVRKGGGAIIDVAS